jgi:hypothetical protein
MGGPGSTRWGSYSKRNLVENCHWLDVRDVMRSEVVLGRRRTLAWSDPWTGSVAFRMHYAVECAPDSSMHINVQYLDGSDSQPAVQIIPLKPMPLIHGVRQWFGCPSCGVRCFKLYRPGQAPFACRRCHRLTYYICQERRHAEVNEEEEALESYIRSRQRLARL